LVVSVVPDVTAITKEFDYVVPPEMRDHVRVGTMVRISLAGRRVGAWVTALNVEPPSAVALRPIAKVTGWGPSADVVELARWAAWRWCGRLPSLLGTASPPGAVVALPPVPGGRPPMSGPVSELAAAALAQPCAVLRLPPTEDPLAVVMAAMALGDALVVAPSVSMARLLAARLKRSGAAVALHPSQWVVAAAGGCTVVGARAAAWAPCPSMAAVVVLDEHDEALQEERSPTWNAREVAIERARRAGVPCLLVSPCPSLEALAAGPLVTASRNEERAAWPILDVVDRSRETGTAAVGPVSERLARLLRTDGRVACVLNRTGRAVLLACTVCQHLATCERCGAAVAQDGEGMLHCRRCGLMRPVVCTSCGSTRLRARKPGIERVAADLRAMLQEPVAVLTAGTSEAPVPPERVVVGTEAVLHQLPDARVVAFLDFDAELLAPRYRANEQALALLARAARLVGRRADGGRVVVQTRNGRHDVLDAVLNADPGRLVAGERARRAELSFPPLSALAVVSGAAAAEFAKSLLVGVPAGVDVLGPSDGTWLLRAPSHRVLCDALAATPRPAGRLRIEVDPLRL